MKPIPDPDVILTFPLEDNETIATYCEIGNLLTFTPAASDHVIKLDGEWPCISICMHNHRNITLDLEDFDAPDLTHIVGNKTLSIYNWDFERTYASHESVSPISTVKNIFNSRIVVSRPNDPNDSEYHTIGYIYGNMRFCEIEIDAPDGCRCIGKVMPGARVCSNNNFSCPDDIETVQCSDLAVTLTSPSCPVATTFGSPPTFTAMTNMDANITFFIDDEPVHSESETRSASFAPVTALPGTYSIKVGATDPNDVHYPDEETCIWTVIEPLALTLTSPSCPVITTEGSPPTFTATTNKNANITFFVNDSPIISYPNTRSASFTPDASTPIDTYVVEVVARNVNNVNETDVKTCSWTVYPPLAVELTSPYLNPSAPIITGDRTGVSYLLTIAATTNRPANLQLFVDGKAVGEIHSNTQTAPFLYLTTKDEHIIEIVAITPCNEEVATTSILWKVLPMPPTNFDVLASDSCQEEGPVFTAEITTTLRRNNTLSLMTFDYDINAITKCSGNENGTLLSAEAWILISGPGMSLIARKLTFPLTHSLQGKITVPVPEMDEYRVDIISKPSLICWQSAQDGIYSYIKGDTSFFFTLTAPP